MSETQNIQWYPGHMAKTRRQMESNLKLVDGICEIRDARIPIASKNPDLDEICGSKPRLIVLNRSDLADPEVTKKWKDYYETLGFLVIDTDCKSKRGIPTVIPAIKQMLRAKLERYKNSGQSGRTLRIMVVGVPNVGKSTFINQISGRKNAAKAENRPGVTRGAQWIRVDNNLELLDTPGILWPKFENPEIGFLLACTGAVKDTIYDTETLGMNLAELLNKRYPDVFPKRYQIETQSNFDGQLLLEKIACGRHFLISGGEPDILRAASSLLEDFKNGRLGRITLETPEMTENEKYG